MLVLCTMPPEAPGDKSDDDDESIWSRTASRASRWRCASARSRSCVAVDSRALVKAAALFFALLPCLAARSATT